MISNYLLRTKIEGLKKKKSDLIQRKAQLEAAFRGTGISKQAAWKQRTGKIDLLDKEDFEARKNLGLELKILEEEFVQINEELRKCFREEESEKNLKLMEVFSEIFTKEQIIEIKKEAERRMAGEHPFRLSFSVREAVEDKNRLVRYRKLAKEQLEKMIEFRILLTSLIEKGCESFGDAEFLKLISPLNRLIIPLSELEKIKRKENL